MRSLHIIYASTSGHTEYVVGVLEKYLRSQSSSVVITHQLAETAKPEDLLRADVLMLASGTWNTGGVEGQLNPHMDLFFKKRAKDADLQGKPCAVFALGDDRYYYTGRAVEHLQQFVKNHGGKQAVPSLLVINDPYGQEHRVEKWGSAVLALLSSDE